MKKAIRFCAAALCAGTLFAGGALAAELPDITLEQSAYRVEIWDGAPEHTISLAEVTQNWGSETRCYGDLLTGDAKTIYNNLVAAFSNPSQLKFTKSEDNRECVLVENVLAGTTPDYRVWHEKAWEDACLAIGAYDYDHPESFFLGGWYSGPASVTGKAGAWYIEMDVIIELAPESVTQDRINAFHSQIQQVATELVNDTAGMSTVAKLAYWDNWFAANNEYNLAAADAGSNAYGNRTPWNVIGGLLSDYSPVCEGYARSMQLLCHKVGIPCVVVTSKTHMWNAVQVDGVWYTIDSTWNDPVIEGKDYTLTYSTRNYFLTPLPDDPKHQIAMDFATATPPISTSDYFNGWTLTDWVTVKGVYVSPDAAAVWVALYDENGKFITCQQSERLDWTDEEYRWYREYRAYTAFDGGIPNEAKYAKWFGVGKDSNNVETWCPLADAKTIPKTAPQ